MIITLATLLWLSATADAAKVLDINDHFPDLIDKHPDKNWLIKFYAPWCHHCQQLEPTYNNVAESVYHKHDNLIVGRVDCTKAGRVCERYGVSSYPTISFINKDIQVSYKGDRTKNSILSFADRLQGPTVNIINDCQELNQAKDKHGLIILSTINNESNEIRKEFESLALTYKSTHWFYQYSGSCKGLFEKEGLYLLKRHLNKSIEFKPPIIGQSPGQSVAEDNNSDLNRAIVDWLNKESFSIYAQISSRNIERILATEKLLVISILDEYKPTRRFTRTSMEFYKRFELLAKDYAHSDEGILIGWSSDIDLIEYITIAPIGILPNVIFLKPDFSYHLLLSNNSDVRPDDAKNFDKIDHELLEKLSGNSIRSLIDEAKTGKLIYNGGNTYLHILTRYIMGNINKFLGMYRANPLLVSVIFGFPSLIIIFVVYTTCFYDSRDTEDDDEGYSDDEYEAGEENRHLLNNGHLKQD
jgi:thioredoxin domain-containing protein 10